MNQFRGLAVFFVLQLVSFAASGAEMSPSIAPTIASDSPVEVIGADDVLSVSVRDCPELTRNFRVATNGLLTLPLLDHPFQASGSTASSLSELIAKELVREDVLVRPVVSVEVTEYHNRSVTVAGAVKHPGRIQLAGRTTLLDALAAAEGTLPDAGPRLLLHSTSPSGDITTRSIPLKELLEKSDSTLNPVLVGGEEIRVPEAEKIYVTGNVRRPGAYAVHDGDTSSVLKVLAQCEGALPYSANTAYVYRVNPSDKTRTEIPVDLGELLARKAVDTPLLGTDILYVPDHRGKRMTAQVLDRVIQFSAYSSSQALVFGR